MPILKWGECEMPRFCLIFLVAFSASLVGCAAGPNAVKTLDISGMPACDFGKAVPGTPLFLELDELSGIYSAQASCGKKSAGAESQVDFRFASNAPQDAKLIGLIVVENARTSGSFFHVLSKRASSLRATHLVEVADHPLREQGYLFFDAYRVPES